VIVMAKSAIGTKRSKTQPTVAEADDRASKSHALQPATVAHADIARRAFELYCDRGCQHGHDLDDWLQAERALHDR
jgi:hypothetical protein